jgi:molybdopterin/thiamine biosynthesis adenylyltransferase
MSPSFNYNEAFKRNIGWFSKSEQAKLRDTYIAIPGLGGVGGEYLITLVRLGVERFIVSDFDEFELANFNRQYGANINTIAHSKLDTMVEFAKQINPNISIKKFGKLKTEENISEFIYMADIVADSIDFFEIEVRREIFKAAHKDHTPVITCAPIGMGCSYSIFRHANEKDIGFDQACGIKPTDDINTQSQKFLTYLSGPGKQVGSYLVDDASIDILNKTAPSTSIGIKLCAGIMCANIVKLILKRGQITYAPTTQFFDPYLEAYTRF